MKILLVSNMYPDKKHPSYGIFVKRFTDELDTLGVEYIKSVMFQYEGKIKKVLGYIDFYIRTFCKIIIGKYDIVYIHYASHSSAPVLAASHFRKIKIYTNLHGSDVVPENYRQKKMQKYTKAILNKSNRVIVPSKYFKDYIKEKYYLDGGKIYIYPSAGIDKEVFHELNIKEKQENRNKFGFNNSFPIFGMAGRISSGKGWDTFVEAVAKIKETDTKANFVIVGSGVESSKLDELIKKKNLENDIKRIELLSQTGLCQFYNAIDYFVFPIKREGESLGLVAIEAMACGTPVIASDFAAPKYYVENGVNGYKFEKDNPDNLANIIKKAAAVINKEQYKQLKKGTVKTADGYDKNNIRYKLKNILDLI